MGCSSSKPPDIYRPPPSSFVVFDINSIQEPWLSSENINEDRRDKSSNVPAQILEKLNKIEGDLPRSWDEVSKALQDLKPTLQTDKKPTATPAKAPVQPRFGSVKRGGRTGKSIHTLEELEATINNSKQQLDRTVEEVKPTVSLPTVSLPSVKSSLKDNPFLVRDRLEREKEVKQANYDG